MHLANGALPLPHTRSPPFSPPPSVLHGMQKTDICAAVARCDMYDFLIDIVPREDVRQARKQVG